MCDNMNQQAEINPSDFYEEIVSRYEQELGFAKREDSLNDRIFDIAQHSGRCIISLCCDIDSEAYSKYLEVLPPAPRADLRWVEGEEPEPETWEEVENQKKSSDERRIEDVQIRRLA